MKAFESDGYRIPLAAHWVFTAVLLFAVSKAPESLYWYLERGDADKTRMAAKKLVRKGAEDLVNEKLAMMCHAMQQESKQVSPPPSHHEAALFWPNLLSQLLPWEQQAADRNSVYGLAHPGLVRIEPDPSALPLLRSIDLRDGDALTFNIAIPTAGILGTFASWWLMRQVGRRGIYLGGLSIMAVLPAGCGVASFLPPYVGWIAGSLFVSYVAFYDMTIRPVCYSMMAEIPSIRHRAVSLAAARATFLFAGVANQIMTLKMVGLDEESWRWVAKTGFLYAALCALSLVYTWFRIPETKDISARELDVLFQNQVSTCQFSSEKAKTLDAGTQATPESELGRASGEVTGRAVTAEQPKSGLKCR